MVYKPLGEQIPVGDLESIKTPEVKKAEKFMRIAETSLSFYMNVQQYEEGSKPSDVLFGIKQDVGEYLLEIGELPAYLTERADPANEGRTDIPHEIDRDISAIHEMESKDNFTWVTGDPFDPDKDLTFDKLTSYAYRFEIEYKSIIEGRFSNRNGSTEQAEV